MNQIRRNKKPDFANVLRQGFGHQRSYVGQRVDDGTSACANAPADKLLVPTQRIKKKPHFVNGANIFGWMMGLEPTTS